MNSDIMQDAITASSGAALEAAILHTVAYADVFDYPLTVEEVHRYLEVPAALNEVAGVIANGAVSHGRLGWRENFVSLPGRENIVSIRRQRQQRALSLWPRAVRYGRVLAAFPFVRMVALTGSLALDNADSRTDLDYFVVTAPDRLWLCRSFLLTVVHWARRRGDVVCPNYLVSERALVLSQRTLFVARELAQMVPLAGFEVYKQLRAANKWSQCFLPNAGGLPPQSRRVPDRGDALAFARPLRLGAEVLLRTPPGGWLDRWEMDRKTARWSQQYPDQSEAAFAADWCKGHFDAHGQRILAAYTERVHAIDEVIS